MAVRRATRTKTRAKAKAAPKEVKAAVSVTIQTAGLPEGAGPNLPRGSVTLDPKGAVKINVERLSRALMRDQRARLVSSMGCVSNPGGPGC
jgi:hypothetical protein